MLRREIPKTADVDIRVEPNERGQERGTTVDEPTRGLVRRALDQATAEVGGLSDCHDVVISQVGGETLVSAHRECDGALGLDDAHALTKELERLIGERLPRLGRVVVHVEPRAS